MVSLMSSFGKGPTTLMYINIVGPTPSFTMWIMLNMALYIVHNAALLALVSHLIMVSLMSSFTLRFTVIKISVYWSITMLNHVNNLQ